MSSPDLKHIASLAKMGAPGNHLLEYLYRPVPCFPENTSPDEMTRLFKSVLARLKTVEIGAMLFERYLCACFLLFRHRLPAWTSKWISSHVHPEGFFPGWKNLVRGDWRSVPVLLTHRDENELLYLIVGAIPSQPDPGSTLWPAWADDLMDNDAKQGICRAAEAAKALLLKRKKEKALFLFPLMPPDPRRPITGGSLSLSAGIGFLSALCRHTLPEELASTGGIASGGVVTKIGGLEEKINLAQTAQVPFKGLIYPLANGYLPNDRPPMLLPVSDLNQAWMFARLFSAEKAGVLVLFSQMMEDPVLFVRNIASMPAEWVHWAAKKRLMRLVLERVIKNPALFEEMAHCFEKSVYRSDGDIAASIAGLFSFGELQAVSKKSPLLAFKWYSAGLSMCNHLGRVYEADSWIKAADRLLPAALAAGMPDAAAYCNHCLVAGHNRYDFRPEIPARMQQVLSMLEAQHQIQCASGCPTNHVLGRIYGSMMQHFAFCGPAFLSQTHALSRLACKALGEGTVPEHDQEWRRQYNYICYAFLDAGSGHHGRAQKSLFTALTASRWDQIRKRLPGLTRWQHALLARFLADVPNKKQRDRYHGYIAAQGAVFPPERFHPWQLWCFNMGRVVWAKGKNREAREWFAQSLEICMSDSLGPTIRVMGLLGLAGVFHVNKTIDPAQAVAYTVIRQTALRLNPIHFQILEQEADLKVLEKIWDNPSRLFPFNYR